MRRLSREDSQKSTAAVVGRQGPEATNVFTDTNYPGLDTLRAFIAHSQILLPERARGKPRLPAGFDEVDIAILDWIAAQGRRASRSLARM